VSAFQFQFLFTIITSTAEILILENFTQSVRSIFVPDEGATMVEYGLMVALIAVVCLLAVTALGVNIRAVFDNIANSV